MTNDDDELPAPWWWGTANGLALWLSTARELRGLSIEMLAARTGLAPRTLEALEGGRVWHVHVGALIRVADALGYRIRFERRRVIEGDAASLAVDVETIRAFLKGRRSGDDR